MPRSLPRLLLASLALAACAGPAPRAPSVAAPDLGKRAEGRQGAISSAHPAASAAGLAMLQRGGNAVDAAVAAAFTLGVAEPQMSGLGGGGNALVWLQRERRAEYLDFYAAQRVASWAGVGPLDTTVASLRLVGIPGEVAGLLALHAKHGRLARAEVMAPAIALAEEGFPVNQVLAQMIVESAPKLRRFEASRALFFPNDTALQPGDLLRNPPLAAVLRAVAADGADGFYRGTTAQRLVEALRGGGHPASLEDLAAYAPQWKRPLCAEYRGRLVLSAPPPQTGLQLLHALNLLEAHDLRAAGLPTQRAEAFDLLASAIRVANLDSRVNADPNWAAVPAAGVVSEAFAAERRALVGTGRAVAELPRSEAAVRHDSLPPSAACAPIDPYRSGTLAVSGGAEAGAAALEAIDGVDPAPSALPDGGETTHLSVVDAEGNAVALTRTNSSTFGSGATVAGFLLNDSGIDLSRGGTGATGRHPWRIRNSTVSPTIVLEDGRAVLVVGSPGGGRIQPAILQTVLYVLDYGLDPLDALRMPRMYPTAAQVRIETENGFSAAALGGARAMGYVPTPDAAGYARVYLVARRGGRWVAAADPRHNGEARAH